MQKRVLFLGASFFQLPPILYAKKEGHYIITCDNVPKNPGHKYADEYHNISTIDSEAVLILAKSSDIDAVVVYASDASAGTAAYVAEKLSLNGNPPDSVFILTHKDIFRNFLRENNFHVPVSSSFLSLDEAEKYLNSINVPVMVKPVDASGSKGVSKVSLPEELPAAFNEAMSYSNLKKIIIEEYVQKKGYQIAGDGFVINGKLVFRCFAQEHFNHKFYGFAPIGESFPLQISEFLQSKIHNEIERLLSLLKMKTGALNFDIILNEIDDVYLIEVAPRAGGHFISEVIKYSTGTDLVKYIVNGALGFDCRELTMYDNAKFYSNYALRSYRDGFYAGLSINESIRDNIVEKILFIEDGGPVKASKNAAGIFGCLILKFDSSEEMLEKMESISDRVKVEVI